MAWGGCPDIDRSVFPVLPASVPHMPLKKIGPMCMCHRQACCFFRASNHHQPQHPYMHSTWVCMYTIVLPLSLSLPLVCGHKWAEQTGSLGGAVHTCHTHTHTPPPKTPAPAPGDRSSVYVCTTVKLNRPHSEGLPQPAKNSTRSMLFLGPRHHATNSACQEIFA